MNTIGTMLSLDTGAIRDIESANSPDKIKQASTAAVKAGEDFEATLMSCLLKQMRQSISSEEGGLFAGDSSDTFGGMFDMFMGKHLAKAGALGIADQVNAYVENSKSDHE